MAADDDDLKARACELVRDQARFLLEDEIGYAAALRSSRNTIATLLLLVVGVGLFRVDLFARPDEALRVYP